MGGGRIYEKAKRKIICEKISIFISCSNYHLKEMIIMKKNY